MDEVKKVLTNIQTALLKVETKGESTLILTDCIRGLQSVIDAIETETEEQTPDISPKSTDKGKK